MRNSTLAGLLLFTAFAGACSSGDSSNLPPLGAWGSNQGSLTIADTTAHLLVASGNCYVAFADISGRIPGGHFSMSGTYTQLVGFAPGSVQYTAQFSGTADANSISVTATVPGLGQSFGPFIVTYGVVKDLQPCAIP